MGGTEGDLAWSGVEGERGGERNIIQTKLSDGAQKVFESLNVDGNLFKFTVI